MLSGPDSDMSEAAAGRVEHWHGTPDPGPYASPMPFNVALRRESGTEGWLNRAHRKFLMSSRG